MLHGFFVFNSRFTKKDISQQRTVADMAYNRAEEIPEGPLKLLRSNPELQSGFHNRHRFNRS